jgi:hypothetical protein
MAIDYNTQRQHLLQPEYGRIIQNMVNYCCTIEDREERTKAAKTVISIMGAANPHLRDVPDFKHKLWDHLAIMSDFKLDIDWPYPLPDKNLLHEKPKRLPYSDNKFRFKHYGKFVEQILKKINDIEDPEKKNALIEIMSNHMKRSYITWKREQISDETIFNELQKLTSYSVEIPEGLKLGDFREILSNNMSQQAKQQPKKKNKRK